MSRRLTKLKYGILTVMRRSTLVVLLVMLCVFLIVYSVVYQRTSAQLKEMALLDSRQSFASVASDINTTLEREWKLLTDSEFQNEIKQSLSEDGVYQNDYQIYARLMLIKKTLKARFSSNALISNAMIFYIRPESDCLCTASFVTNDLQQDYDTGILRFENMDYSEFRDYILSVPTSKYIRSSMKTGPFTYKYNNGFSAKAGFLACRSSDMNASAPLYVALQINLDYLQSLFTSLHYAIPSYCEFTEEQIFVASGEVESIEGQDEDFVFIDDDNRIYICRYIPCLGVYCTIMLDNSVIYAGIESFRTLFRLILYVVLFLLIGLTCTFFLRWHYPVLQLANQLPGTGTMSPITVIDNHITELHRQNDTYQEKLRILEPARQADILRAALNGEGIATSEWEELTAITGISSSSVFRCICIGALNASFGDEDLFTCVNPVVHDKLNRIAASICIDRAYIAIVLVDPNTAEQFRMDLEDVLASLNSLHENCLYAIGMSDSYIGRSSLHNAYQEAMLGWKDAYTWKNSSIVNSDTVAGNSSDYNVDYKQLDTIYNFLLHGDVDSALQTYDTLVKQNFNPQSDQKLRQVLFQQFSFDIIGILARLASQYNLNEVIDSLLSQERELSVGEMLEQLRYALGHCGELIPKKDSRDDLSAAICQYCEDHYQDSVLSLATIADEFGFTESNMSKFFKAHTGMSYSVYIENLRISHAEPLLTSTAKSVKDIASMVGYQNVTTFYNAFRRKYGCTPSQWIEGHRAGANDSLGDENNTQGRIE